MKRMNALLCLLLCLTLLLTGCGAKSADSAASDEMAYMATESANGMALYDGMEYAAAADRSETEENTGDRKLIWRADLSLETTAFDDAIALLEQRTAESGGWVESSELQGSSRYDSARYGWYTLRIPAEKLNEFLSDAGDLGTVLSSSRSSWVRRAVRWAWAS